MKIAFLTAAISITTLSSTMENYGQGTAPDDNNAAVRASIACGLAHLRDECRRGDDGLPVLPSNRTGISNRANTSDRWGEGYIGNNAIVLLAMRKAGAPPSDPCVAQLAKRLIALVETYGIPDTTWDVTWLGAALANLPGDDFTELRERVLGKLMDGQVNSGKSRGLWGPVCINPRMLAEIREEEAALDARISAAKASGNAPDARLTATRDLLRVFKRASALQGDRNSKITQNYDITPKGAPPITLQGLPYSCYAQTFADLETTAYALFALREAKRNGVLPERSWRPRSKTARLPIVPVKASLVLEQAVTALSNAQRSDGSWDECNFHQPQDEFKDESYGRLPPDLLVPLTSRISTTTTAQGIAAVLDGLEAADEGGRLSIESYVAELERAAEVLDKQLEGFVVAASTPSTTEKSVFPWNTFFSLRRLQRAWNVPELDAIDLERRLVRYAVSQQNSDGSWGVGRPARQGQDVAPHPQASTALRAWQQTFKAKRAALPEAQGRKLGFLAMDMVRAQEWLGSDYGALRPVATAFAMMFLAESARPPVAGYLRAMEMKTSPPTLTRAVAYMGTETGVPVLFQRLGIPPRKADLVHLPVIVLAGTSPLNDSETRELLKEYVTSGGILIVELYDSMDIYREQRTVSELLPFGRVRALPSDEPFMVDFQGAKPTIKAAYSSESELFAVFLQLEAASGRSKSGALPISKAVQTAYLLIKHRMDDTILQQSYLHETPGYADPFEARKAALKALDAQDQVPDTTPPEQP